MENSLILLFLQIKFIISRERLLWFLAKMTIWSWHCCFDSSCSVQLWNVQKEAERASKSYGHAFRHDHRLWLPRANTTSSSPCLYQCSQHCILTWRSTPSPPIPIAGASMDLYIADVSIWLRNKKAKLSSKRLQWFQKEKWLLHLIPKIHKTPLPEICNTGTWLYDSHGEALTLRTLYLKQAYQHKKVVTRRQMCQRSNSAVVMSNLWFSFHRGRGEKGLYIGEL